MLHGPWRPGGGEKLFAEPVEELRGGDWAEYKTQSETQKMAIPQRLDEGQASLGELQFQEVWARTSGSEKHTMHGTIKKTRWEIAGEITLEQKHDKAGRNKP